MAPVAFVCRFTAVCVSTAPVHQCQSLHVLCFWVLLSVEAKGVESVSRLVGVGMAKSELL